MQAQEALEALTNQEESVGREREKTLTTLPKGEEEAEEEATEAIETLPQVRKEVRVEEGVHPRDQEIEMTDHRSKEKENHHKN